MQNVILLLITAALPLAWLIADFRGSAGTRRALGGVAILWSFGVAALVGSFLDFNANVYFTTATKDFIQASIEQLRAGRTDAVLREWSRADSQFSPTYENRARYRQTVDQAIDAMKKP
jgi:hypothetical protein